MLNLINLPKHMVINIFLQFNNAQKVDEADIQRIKWDEDYLKKHVDSNIRTALRGFWKDLCQTTYEIYDKNGITKDDAIEMCRSHDENAKKGPNAHPLTDLQSKKQEDAKKKQQEQVEEAKKNKLASLEQQCKNENIS